MNLYKVTVEIIVEAASDTHAWDQVLEAMTEANANSDVLNLDVQWPVLDDGTKFKAIHEAFKARQKIEEAEADRKPAASRCYRRP